MLPAALNLIADGDTTQLDDDAIAWLAGLAAIRAGNRIPAAAPLDTAGRLPGRPGRDRRLGAAADFGIDL